MTAPRLTAADAELIADLAQQGVEVTPSQLKRWRAAKLLPTPRRTARGRGPGRTSDSYPPGTTPWARAIAEIVGSGTRLTLVPVALFVRGFDIEDADQLRRSYQVLLDELALPVDEGEEPEDAADHVAQHLLRRTKRHPMGRAWRQRSGHSGARHDSPLLDTLAGLTALFFTDTTPTHDAASAMAQAFGASENLEVVSQLGKFNVAVLRAFIQDAALDDLLKARHFYSEFLSLAARLQHMSAKIGRPVLGIDFFDVELVKDWEGPAIAILATGIALANEPGMESRIAEIETAVSAAENTIESATQHEP